MRIDIENLLSEVSVEAPCGEDLSEDASFFALENMLQTKGGGGVVAGVEEAVEEPKWQEVRERSLELIQRSKDLWIAMYLTLACLKIDGLSGLCDGLALLQGLLERFWEHLYPRLDPDDDPESLGRINILQSLSPPSVNENDLMKFKQRLAEVPLSNSRMGRFSFRHIQLANGQIPVPTDEEDKVPDISLIDAAFQGTATDELQAVSQSTEEAIEHLTNITTVFAKNDSQGQMPDLSGFQSVLGNIHKCIQGYLAKRGYSEAVEEGTSVTSNEVGERSTPVASIEAEKGRTSPTGEIRSPQEALLAIEKVCQYFDHHEPSSPVPLLLRRAQKLVSKNFMEVIADICPDAMSRVQMIGGVGSDDPKSVS